MTKKSLAQTGYQNQATKAEPTPASMLDWALGYADRGWPIFPIRAHGKAPLTEHGWKDATTDRGQIRRWWGQWPDANIGFRPGSADVVALDFDPGTDGYAGAELLAELGGSTVSATTPAGGTHLFCKLPDGLELDNSPGALPKGVDVRAHGGYVLLAPSIVTYRGDDARRKGVQDGHSGRYAFSPAVRTFAELPAAVLALILDGREATTAAPQRRRPAAVELPPAPAERPDLAHWRLSPDVRELIEHAAPKGKRSEADAKIITALLYAGATDAEIVGVFAHYPCGLQGKLSERGPSYLATTIANMRRYTEEHPPPARLTPAQLAEVQGWIVSPACAEALRAAGVKRAEPYRRTLAAVLQIAERAGGSVIITPGLRAIAETIRGGLATVSRHLRTLTDAGMLTMEKGPEEGSPWTIGLQFAIACVSGTPTAGSNCGSCSTYARYRILSSDDAFLGPYRYDWAALWHAELPMMERSLTAADALAWAALEEHGELTRRDLCDETGLAAGGAGGAMRRLEAFGLVEREREGRSFVYRLTPEAEARLTEIRPALPTYGLTLKRLERFTKDRAQLAEQRGQVKRAEVFEERRHRLREAAEAAGLDLAAKLSAPVRPAERGKMRAGTALEWAAVLATGKQRAEAMRPAHLTDGERYRRREYAKAKAEARELWPVFWAWLKEQGVPLASMTETDLLGQFKQWEIAGQPPIRFVAPEQLPLGAD